MSYPIEFDFWDGKVACIKKLQLSFGRLDSALAKYKVVGQEAIDAER